MMVGFGFFGLVLMILFWGGLIVLAVWLVKFIFQNNAKALSPPPGKNSNALEVLDERYARGEINREQYELMKQDISQ